MAYEWIDEYIMKKPGVEKEFKVEWNMTRYLLCSKQFIGFGGDKYAKPIYTFKLDPAFSEFLRAQYACVVPGYYSNKVHWSSMYLDGDVPDDIVRDMIENAYKLIFDKLPKKAREEIQNA